MGYPTEFEGSVSISPPLNAHEIAYLRKFAATRRMDRAPAGPTSWMVRDRSVRATMMTFATSISPPAGQPELWCSWEPTTDGTAIKWTGGEKFYNADEWMTYLIDLFLKPGRCRPRWTALNRTLTPRPRTIRSASICPVTTSRATSVLAVMSPNPTVANTVTVK